MNATRPKISRRTLLKSAGALGAGYWLGSQDRSVRAEPPSEKLNLAIIGPGGRGEANLDNVKSQNIVAICDVDEQRAGRAYERFAQAKKFYDFREMFDRMSGEIDGVVISTPDHMHFHPAWWAMQRGKHVYLEKPLAHSVWETRQLTRLAAEKKLATQLGIQRHDMKELRRNVELVKSGILGDIREVYSWLPSDRGMYPGPALRQSPPSTLKWDLWLGPAEAAPIANRMCPTNGDSGGILARARPATGPATCSIFRSGRWD